MKPTHSQAVRSRREVGQTLAEFALILLVLMLLIMGIVDFSRAVYARTVMASVAREGARYATANMQATDEQVKAVAKALAAGLNKDDISITFRRNAPLGDTDNGEVELVVTYIFRPASGLIAGLMSGGSGPGILLRSHSVMRQEVRP